MLACETGTCLNELRKYYLSFQSLKGLSHLGDRPQRSRNARKNQPNAGER